MCNKIYSYELYKSHTEICKVELKPVIKQQGEKMDSDKNKNLKIKVLQGILCQDENMKPYIEYILEISLNMQVWRLNKKFSQFVNLHRALLKRFPDMQISDSANIFYISEMNQNFHENKIKILESYMKELVKFDYITNSSLFKLFLGFDSYYDADLNDKENMSMISNENEDKNNNFQNLNFEDKENKSNLESYTNDYEEIKKQIRSIKNNDKFNTVKYTNSIIDKNSLIRIPEKIITKKDSNQGNNQVTLNNVNFNQHNLNNTGNKNSLNQPLISPNNKTKELFKDKDNIKENNNLNTKIGTNNNNQSTNEKIIIKTHDPNVIIDKLNVKKKPVINKLKNQTNK